MTAPMQKSFDSFIEAIDLTQTAIDRIERAYSALTDFLVDNLNLHDADVFLQGSYPTGTAVRPVEGGEYDVDVACIMGLPGETADAVLERLEELLRSHGRYADRIIPKKPCIRLEYAEDLIGKFHIDVVPMRRTGSEAGSLEVPRRGEGWHQTAPLDYVRWCIQQGQQFERTVRTFKRWRDDNQTAKHAIKSVLLQVLVSAHMPDEPSDALRLQLTLKRMHGALAPLNTCPRVANPVLPNEDLARRWTAAAFKEFVGELEEACELATRATSTTDVVESSTFWRELLGDAFPLVPSEELGIRISDDSHAASFAEQGWAEALDEQYGVRVVAETRRGKKSPRGARLSNDGSLLFHGSWLRFEALLRGADDAEVWWQVANTGRHARDSHGLRGGFFRAKRPDGKPSADPRENWESTSYTGSHWIRAVVVKENRVVAKSDKFVVNVYNRTARFGL